MKVLMINSVGEYVAGEEYELDDATSDRFVILGYAEGVVSRDYEEQELQLIAADHQLVNV